MTRKPLLVLDPAKLTWRERTALRAQGFDVPPMMDGIAGAPNIGMGSLSGYVGTGLSGPWLYAQG